MNGSPLRQHQSSSRGQSSNRAPPDRSTVLYTRMIRMAAAIQQVSMSTMQDLLLPLQLLAQLPCSAIPPGISCVHTADSAPLWLRRLCSGSH
jgi:hypothetical protein